LHVQENKNNKKISQFFLNSLSLNSTYYLKKIYKITTLKQITTHLLHYIKKLIIKKRESVNLKTALNNPFHNNKKI